MKRYTLLALGLALVGCVTANVQTLSPKTYAAIPVDSVTVFLDVSELQADSIAYERLALIHLKGDQTFTDQESLFKKAREKAAELGANGVVFAGMEEGRTTWNWLTGASTSNRQAQAFAIRWCVISGRDERP